MRTAGSFMGTPERDSTGESPVSDFSEDELKLLRLRAISNPHFDEEIWTRMDPTLKQSFLLQAKEELEAMEMTNPALKLSEIDKDVYGQIVVTLAGRMYALFEERETARKSVDSFTIDDLLEILGSQGDDTG